MNDNERKLQKVLDELNVLLKKYPPHQRDGYAKLQIEQLYTQEHALREAIRKEKEKGHGR